WLGFIAFVAVALAIQASLLLIKDHSTVWQGDLLIESGMSHDSISNPLLHISGDSSDIRVEQQTNVDNGWLDTELTLTNRNSGEVFQLSREISEYHGYDDGESWSEGSNKDEAVIAAVPAGDYVLEVEG
ncbi:hypothetical protein, partial [Chitinimonas sp.]|uniref:hypothetical protein n=1 Tax=Chitinimonas sp. TaxID=1934313 RepID=UPI0035B4F77B